MTVHPCNTCGGKRLKKEALAVKVGGKNISELTDMSIDELKDFISNLNFDSTKKP